jgi:hypothetical protein
MKPKVKADSIIVKMYLNLRNVQLKSRSKMNCLISIKIIKGKYFWFPIGNIFLNHVNIFIHTDYLITKLDTISVSKSANPV